MASRQLILTLALAVAVVVVVAGVAVYYVTRPGGSPPPPSTACNGSRTYAGTVIDTNGIGLGAVVVDLAAAPPGDGVNASVTTAADGSWRATLSGVCTYTAALYWQSAADGPHLATVSGLAPSSTLRVNVSRAPVTLQWIKEFPNSAGTNASLFLPARNLTFSVEARSSGNISLGFLPLDFALRPAMNFSYPHFLNVSGTAPYAIADAGAVAYRVVAANGSWVVYAAPGPSPALSLVNAKENLTMAQAILLSGPNPYATVPAHQTLSAGYAILGEGGLNPVGVATVAFGTPLLGYFSIVTQNWPSTFPQANVTLTNSGGGSVCYVVYAQALNVHA